MSNSILNGRGKPRIVIYDKTDKDSSVKSIDLPLCNYEGRQTETNTPKFRSVTIEKTGEVFNYDFKGWNILFTLSFVTWITKEDALIIQDFEDNYLMNFEKYKIVLIPRTDALQRRFEVTIPNDYSYSIGNNTGNTTNGMVLRLITVKPIDNRHWVNTDNLLTPTPQFLKTAS